MAAREVELPPIRVAGRTREIGLLVEARGDAVAETTRVRNRVHADLMVLIPGCGDSVGRRALRLDLVLRALHAETRTLTTRIGVLVGAHPLLDVPGAGVLTAAKLIAETGDVGRFRSSDAFAGVAPIPASSGQRQRMRLNRGEGLQMAG